MRSAIVVAILDLDFGQRGSAFGACASEESEEGGHVSVGEEADVKEEEGEEDDGGNIVPEVDFGAPHGVDVEPEQPCHLRHHQPAHRHLLHRLQQRRLVHPPHHAQHAHLYHSPCSRVPAFVSSHHETIARQNKQEQTLQSCHLSCQARQGLLGREGKQQFMQVIVGEEDEAAGQHKEHLEVQVERQPVGERLQPQRTRNKQADQEGFRPVAQRPALPQQPTDQTLLAALLHREHEHQGQQQRQSEGHPVGRHQQLRQAQLPAHFHGHRVDQFADWQRPLLARPAAPRCNCSMQQGSGRCDYYEWC